MPRRCTVVAGGPFERDARRLRKHRPQVYESLLDALELLEQDPYNLRRRANIRKLVDVPQGEGQFRLRVGDSKLFHNLRWRL